MKIILNIATHGDEKIGYEVVKEIEKLHIDKKILAVQIANKKASHLNRRFVDQDLNRSFPGKKDGNHEEKLAYRLSPIIKLVDLVIDIHSTTSQLKDALIVTKLDTNTVACVKAIQPKNLLFMNPVKLKATKHNALISQAKIGVAFEYGRDDDPVTVGNIVLGIKRLFNYVGITDLKLPKTKVVTNYFEVVSRVNKPQGYILNKDIRNYILVKKGSVYATNGKKHLIAKKDFYPILFGENKYKDFFGFSGKKIKPRIV